MKRILTVTASAFALGGLATPALAQHEHMPGMEMPPTTPEPKAAEPPADHSHMSHKATPVGEHAGHAMAMTGVLGSYPMERESSGTAWQPDASEHDGLHIMSGDWTLMAHGVLNFVYDQQSGPRGDEKAFASGMLMGMVSARVSPR